MKNVGDKRKLVSILAAATLLAVTPMAATAQNDFPYRAVKIIVPIPPGPTADALPRIVADKLSARWRQPVVIENWPGAALNIGAEAAAKAEPDGYTLLATPAPPLAINQSLYPRLGFDPTAFVPVTILAMSPNVLVVNPKIPAASLAELISFGKANPGRLSYASSGNGSTPHLTMELLSTLAGIKLVHVPYKGLGPALTDLLAGHVDLMFDNLGNVLGPIENGKLRGLGVGSGQRVAKLPDIPTMAESFPGFLSVAWFAIVAPPRTPPDIAARLSAAIAEIIQEPDVSKKFADLSSTPVGSTPAETAAFIKEEHGRWRKVIEAAGIRPD